MKKTLGISVVLLFGMGSAYALADSNPVITNIVDALNGRTLVCTSSDGDVVRFKGAAHELQMTAKFNTDGYDAENDDGPSGCTEKVCEMSGSTDSDSGGMAQVLVTQNMKTNDTRVDLNFGDDNQNNYIMYLPDASIGYLQQGTSFAATGVYAPLPDNKTAPAGGVKVTVQYTCSI